LHTPKLTLDFLLSIHYYKNDNNYYFHRRSKMNNKAFYNLTYGVFLLAAKAEEKANACIVNTGVQVAGSPVRVAVSVLKGEKVDPVLVIPTTIVDRSNVDEYLDPNNTVY